jgi:hypothetical protein
MVRYGASVMESLIRSANGASAGKGNEADDATGEHPYRRACGRPLCSMHRSGRSV